ncbi:MAG: lysozyme [Magnetococcales bacterium]|nr:lysozyme [Magnetococcales bacterium]
MDREALTKQLIRHEGIALRPYLCPAGRVTIGVGRNLEDVGISEAEAMVLLNNDLDRVEGELQRYLPGFNDLNDVRRCALMDMCFNLGISRFRLFQRFVAAINNKDFTLAAQEMLDSRWAKQVGERAKYLSRMVETGKEMHDE